MIQRFDIILADLNPVKGSEQSGIRSCLVIQNDFANKYANTFVIAILSSVIKEYPHTLIIEPSLENGCEKQSRIDFLQVRTIDESRILKKMGALEKRYWADCNAKIETAFGLF